MKTLRAIRSLAPLASDKAGSKIRVGPIKTVVPVRQSLPVIRFIRILRIDRPIDEGIRWAGRDPSTNTRQMKTMLRKAVLSCPASLSAQKCFIASAEAARGLINPAKSAHSEKDGRCGSGMPIVTLPRLSSHPRRTPILKTAFDMLWGVSIGQRW